MFLIASVGVVREQIESALTAAEQWLAKRG
jgi:hypothetical protein